MPAGAQAASYACADKVADAAFYRSHNGAADRDRASFTVVALGRPRPPGGASGPQPPIRAARSRVKQVSEQAIIVLTGRQWRGAADMMLRFDDSVAAAIPTSCCGRSAPMPCSGTIRSARSTGSLHDASRGSRRRSDVVLIDPQFARSDRQAVPKRWSASFRAAKQASVDCFRGCPMRGGTTGTPFRSRRRPRPTLHMNDWSYGCSPSFCPRRWSRRRRGRSPSPGRYQGDRRRSAALFVLILAWPEAASSMSELVDEVEIERHGADDGGRCAVAPIHREVDVCSEALGVHAVSPETHQHADHRNRHCSADGEKKG